jgi:hypothetical protein
MTYDKSQQSQTVSALIQLNVACNLALDALPELPPETTQALQEPVRELCDITARELDSLDPAWREITQAD